MAVIIFVDFLMKQEIDSQVPTVSNSELDQISSRMDELSCLIDEAQTDEEEYMYHSELEELLSRMNNSMQLLRNKRKQKKLLGTRLKGQRPKIA